MNLTSNTLQVFDVGGAYIQQLEAGGIETGTLGVRTNLTVFNDADIKGGLSLGTGGLFSAGSVGIGASTSSVAALRVNQLSTGPSAVFMGGNVGIGTSSPSSFNLQVVGSVGPGGDDLYDLGSSTLRWRDLYLGPTSLNLVCTAGECGTARNWKIAVQESSTGQGNLRFALAGADFLNISPAGNIGIGTTSPTQLFQINPSGSTSFVVTSSGNVGIGTTSPTSTLTVLGTANITGNTLP